MKGINYVPSAFCSAIINNTVEEEPVRFGVVKVYKKKKKKEKLQLRDH